MLLKTDKEEILRNEVRVQFKHINGILQDIREYLNDTFYADGIPYYSKISYEIDILTDDMYTITIKPIAEGTLKDILKMIRSKKTYLIN